MKPRLRVISNGALVVSSTPSNLSIRSLEEAIYVLFNHYKRIPLEPIDCSRLARSYLNGQAKLTNTGVI